MNIYVLLFYLNGKICWDLKYHFIYVYIYLEMQDVSMHSLTVSYCKAEYDKTQLFSCEVEHFFVFTHFNKGTKDPSHFVQFPASKNWNGECFFFHKVHNISASRRWGPLIWTTQQLQYHTLSWNRRRESKSFCFVERLCPWGPAVSQSSWTTSGLCRSHLP